jgi:regulator of protease activity HflC (stomatin/prohibitin superfamily)
MLHAADGFSRLRWVISKDAVGNLPAIESVMRGVLSRREVREVLKAQGLILADVRAALDAALQGRLLEFF